MSKWIRGYTKKDGSYVSSHYKRGRNNKKNDFFGFYLILTILVLLMIIKSCNN